MLAEGACDDQPSRVTLARAERTIGDAEWLRRRTDAGWPYAAMLWRYEPMTVE